MTRANEQAVRPIRAILVATDFSEIADYVLDRAVEIARQADATVDLVHVKEPFVYPLTRGFAPTSEQEKVLIDWIDNELTTRVVRTNNLGVRCMGTLREGNPQREIIRYATDSHKDLIVIGTHGRTGFDHAVFGSVAERVVQKALCPVLVIPRRAPAAKD